MYRDFMLLYRRFVRVLVLIHVFQKHVALSSGYLHARSGH